MYIQNTKPRGMVLFEESIKSKYTKKNYICHLNQFMLFSNIKTIDELLEISNYKIQCLLEDYLIELKQTTNPNSIPSKFQGIKHFCVMNRVNINWNIIQKMYPQKQKIGNLRCYTTKEIRKLISDVENIRDKAIIHFLASTGARIGVFDHELSVRHLKKMPYGCNAINLYAGHIEEYWAFLTPQATKMLDSYHNYRKEQGEKFSEHTPIFATKTKIPDQLGWNGARSVIYRAISKCNEIRNKQNDRYDVQADHGFRKRFNTTLKLNNSINYNIAEKLMGHKNGLDGVYLTPTIEQCFTEFKKAIQDLTI